MSDLLIQKLKSVRDPSGVAKRIADLLPSSRGMSEMTVKDVLDSYSVKDRPERQKVIDVFHELEKLELGKFMTGRRGKETRFEWDKEMLKSGSVIVKPIPEDEDDERNNGSSMQHTFRLRRDLTVQFELPHDFNALEASRLADFIKTLPFGAS